MAVDEYISEDRIGKILTMRRLKAAIEVLSALIQHYDEAAEGSVVGTSPDEGRTKAATLREARAILTG